MSQSQNRHKRKAAGSIASHQGEQVHVTRQLESGEVVEYDATFLIDRDGRALLERIKFLHACIRIGAYRIFRAALDIPVKGFPDWFIISGHYVLMNARTQGRTYSAAVMDIV